jgi:NitT/TauT family transport system substrate-binding protein
MSGKKRSKLLISLLVLASVLLAACAQAATQPTTQTETPGTTSNTTGQEGAEPTSVRMALLPIVDNLPMYVAQQEGLFNKSGLNVDLIPVASAAERDQVVNAGQADGMINELISTLLYNKDQVQVQVVRFARAATPETHMYSILASGKNDINSPEGLKGVEIGISQGTIIEYVTDRLLQAEGLASEEIKSVAVPKMPDRMALLGTGELKAATLPEPLASVAIGQGARVVVDDTRHPEYGYSTYAFRKAFIDEHPEAVRAFLAAIEEAVALINADPSKYKPLLMENNLLPEPVAGSFEVPNFVTASVPPESSWNDSLAWMKEKGLISTEVPYSSSVTADYLPK